MLDLTIFQQPAVRGRDRRRLHQRPLALRPALHLRLLLPGGPGRRPDHRRDQARPDGDRDADRLAARRDLGRSPRLPRARGPRDARQRASALALMTTPAGRQPLLGERRSGCSWSGIGSGMFNSPNTAAMMGTVPTASPRDRGRRADDAPEHRRRDLDRVRARDRHRRGAEGRSCSRSSPASPRASRSAKLDPFIHNMHTALWVLAATSVVGAGVSLLRPAPRQAAAGVRRTLPRSAARSPRSPHERAGRARRAELRIGDVAKLAGHDAADDPLLRGDRPAARRPAGGSPAPTAPTARTTSSASGAAAAEGPARASRWRS